MRRPAPRIGQHNAEILAELGITTAEREQEMPV
jgi:crotonobetainyl-CoA:carnitine CoA-transferase CaiB-like acyl-CoA transferase